MRASSEDLLHRYPGPVLLRASRRNWLFTFITCIVFTVIGILMIRDGEMKGWLLTIFFGLGTPIAFVKLLDLGWLRLDAEGFEFNQMFRRQRVAWHDAAGFLAVDVPGASRELVCYDDVNVSEKMADLNRSMAGRNAALPEAYDLPAEDLAQLMNAWRDRALVGG
jgi:hypothetical protein